MRYIFSEGMTYVALSRVRSLIGLYLSAFNPQSIMVSTKCLKEVNRLRQSFRSDLPLYDIPVKSAKNTKSKLTAITTSDEPRPKTSRQDPTSSSTSTLKRKRESTDTLTVTAKRECYISAVEQADDCPFKYHPVDEQWQSAQMG